MWDKWPGWLDKRTSRGQTGGMRVIISLMSGESTVIWWIGHTSRCKQCEETELLLRCGGRNVWLCPFPRQMFAESSKAITNSITRDKIFFFFFTFPGITFNFANKNCYNNNYCTRVSEYIPGFRIFSIRNTLPSSQILIMFILRLIGMLLLIFRSEVICGIACWS